MELLCYPVLLGRDFNLVTEAKDKSNGLSIVIGLVYSMTRLINGPFLEIKLTTMAFTWSSNQDSPIFSAINIVFSFTDWDSHFRLSTVISLHRVGTDHAPHLLDTGESHSLKHKPFRFEKWWLVHPDFIPLVHQIWATPSTHTSAIDIWQFKVKLFRQKVKGRSINLEAALKTKKKYLLLEYAILDVFS